ncbi:MAG TPA: hypothetical protein VEL75_18470 [Candidatus Methylomirabilis sp.]|nr:hypothetical protein [Gemmatimonadales bacterium]HYB43770.1 hypothetical protein [Candidatus Methylomirabilis sp.]
MGAVTRKLLGGGRRARLGKDGVRTVIGMHIGDTDPGREAVGQLTADLEALRDEVGGLRREMDETLNRLDFTERLLTQARERGLLNAPKERA